jgi:hypothetical protein
VVDPEKPDQLDRRTDLFPAFARRRPPWVLVIVDESSGQAPPAQAGLDRATTQHHAAVDLDHHRGRDLGVVPEDEVVLGTGLDVPTLDDAGHELGPAVQAVMAHSAFSRPWLRRSASPANKTAATGDAREPIGFPLITFM